MNHVPPRFSPIEILPARSVMGLPSCLRNIDPPTNYKAILIRLLTGTVDFRCEPTGMIVKQRMNYGLVLAQKNGRLSKRIIAKTVSG